MPPYQKREIVIGGKKYIDLIALEDAIKDVCPLKVHSLRRLARYGRIPYRHIGISRTPKYWFDLAEVRKALKLALEDDSSLIEVDNNTDALFSQDLNMYDVRGRFEPEMGNIEDYLEGL
jgi:hypothetical protein